MKLCQLCGKVVKPSLFSNEIHTCPEHGSITKVKPFEYNEWWTWPRDTVFYELNPGSEITEIRVERLWKLHDEMVEQNRCGFMLETGYCGYPDMKQHPDSHFIDKTCLNCVFYHDPWNFFAIRQCILKLINEELTIGELFERVSTSKENIARALIYLHEHKLIKV